MLTVSRRSFLAFGAGAAVLGATTRRPLAAPLKLVGIHAVPIENTWNSRLQVGMLAPHQRGDVNYEWSENVSNADYERVMREYAEGGAQLIVGESYGVETAARVVAADYPEVAFLMGSSGEPAGTNFSVFGTWNNEAGYLSGMVAGKLSKSNIFGSVGGYPIPEVNRLINAFRDGVREVNPDPKFLISFIGTWFDPPKAKEAGLAQIDTGADVLFAERIGTSDAAKERGIIAIGTLKNWIPDFPGTVVASVQWNFEPIVAAAIADVKAGNIVARDYSEFSYMKHGGNELVIDENAVPPDVAAAALARQEEIRAGTFTVPVDDSQPT